MLQTHYNIAGARHVSKSLIFTLISSCPTFCFDDIPFISLNILLALLSVSFTCSFGSTYLLFVQHAHGIPIMQLATSSIFPSFTSSSICSCFCLPVLIVKHFVFFSPFCIFFLCFHFSAVSDHVRHIASYLATRLQAVDPHCGYPGVCSFFAVIGKSEFM